jgi:hypothetical protein
VYSYAAERFIFITPSKMHCQIGSFLDGVGIELNFPERKSARTREKKQLRKSNNILAVNQNPGILKTFKKRKY